MPLDETALKDLKASLSAARKKEMNFALCMGKKTEGTVLMIDRIKDPSVLYKQAKRDGETAKLAFGTIKIDGSKAHLNCMDEPPPGCGRKLKEFFSKTVGMKLKVIIQDGEGNLLEGDDEDQDEGQSEDSSGNEAEQKWAETFETLDPEVQACLQAGKGDVARVKKVWDFACEKANEEDFDAAMKMADKLPAILEEVAEEAAADGDTPDAEDAPAQEDISDALAETLRAEFEQLGPDIAAAATSLDKRAAAKTGMLAERFEADLASDPKRAASVLSLLKTTLQAALDAGTEDSGQQDPEAAAARRSELEELEKGVDALLAEFA